MLEKNEKPSKPPKKRGKAKKSYGIEVISTGENPNIKKGTIIPIYRYSNYWKKGRQFCSFTR